MKLLLFDPDGFPIDFTSFQTSMKNKKKKHFAHFFRNFFESFVGLCQSQGGTFLMNQKKYLLPYVPKITTIFFHTILPHQKSLQDIFCKKMKKMKNSNLSQNEQSLIFSDSFEICWDTFRRSMYILPIFYEAQSVIRGFLY